MKRAIPITLAAFLAACQSAPKDESSPDPVAKEISDIIAGEQPKVDQDPADKVYSRADAERYDDAAAAAVRLFERGDKKMKDGNYEHMLRMYNAGLKLLFDGEESHKDEMELGRTGLNKNRLAQSERYVEKADAATDFKVRRNRYEHALSFLHRKEQTHQVQYGSILEKLRDMHEGPRHERMHALYTRELATFKAETAK